MLIFLVLFAKAYEETLTFVPIDTFNTLSILHFSDTFERPLPLPFTDLGLFPGLILELLDFSSTFTATLVSGTADAAIPRLLDYNNKTGKKVKIFQPGFTVFAKTENCEGFMQKLAFVFGVAKAKQKGPVEVENGTFWHSSEFLCVENLKNVEKLLPCRGKGLSLLFDQMVTSKFVSIEIHAEMKSIGEYVYSITVMALRKEQYLGLVSQCNTKIEVFEETLEEYPANIRFSKLALSPVRSKNQSLLKSTRFIQDDEHGFSADFFHSFTNSHNDSITVTIYEYFPYALTPLLSTISHSFTSLSRYHHGWLLKFQLILPIGEETIHIKLDKKILGFEQYPTDPQRGWDIPSMPFYYKEETFVSNSLLVMIPEPDFSMPFNVICITGTVLAFFFTSLQSLQTWKDAVHWSSDSYEKSIIKARNMMNWIRNIVLAVSISVLYILDRKGIVKMFG